MATASTQRIITSLNLPQRDFFVSTVNPDEANKKEIDVETTTKIDFNMHRFELSKDNKDEKKKNIIFFLLYVFLGNLSLSDLLMEDDQEAYKSLESVQLQYIDDTISV
ncbi:transmembrane protein, putative [Medicago truncatula]|uniref:Transmembrane protein, putative n=1 Tax=Medicago truncatula TaxID=3880 RepID=G7JRG5_MEDTR|nr:transmembrane protein, putative [Medicago truncatula]